jgi:hypothetical protein
MEISNLQKEAEAKASIESKNNLYTCYVIFDTLRNNYSIRVIPVDINEYQTVAAYSNGIKLNERNW